MSSSWREKINYVLQEEEGRSEGKVEDEQGEESVSEGGEGRSDGASSGGDKKALCDVSVWCICRRPCVVSVCGVSVWCQCVVHI